MRESLKKEFGEQEAFFKQYKFLCSLPKEQATMLSYLIDVEDISNIKRLPGDNDYFQCNQDGFINHLLSGWSVKEINRALKNLVDAGYIEKKMVNINMRNCTFIKLNRDAIKRLSSQYQNNKLASIQNVNSETYEEEICTDTNGEVIKNNNQEQILKNDNQLSEGTGGGTLIDSIKEYIYAFPVFEGMEDTSRKPVDLKRCIENCCFNDEKIIPILMKWYNNVGKGKVTVEQLREKISVIIEDAGGIEEIVYKAIHKAFMGNYINFVVTKDIDNRHMHLTRDWDLDTKKRIKKLSWEEQEQLWAEAIKDMQGPNVVYF